VSSTQVPPSRVRAAAEIPPALACVVRRALGRLSEKRPDFVGLASIVEVDPVLCGTVSRVVRSPLYFDAAAVDGWERAVSMLGRDAMERLLRAMPLVEATPAAIDAACRRFTRGLAAAAAARFLSNQGACDAPDDAYLAALLHDVGRHAAPGDASDDEVAERTAAVATAWRLPSRVVAAVRRRASSAPVVSVAYGDETAGAIDATAARLAAVVVRGAELATQLGYGANEARPQAPLDDAEIGAVRDAIELELVHAAAILEVQARGRGEFVPALIRAETAARRESDARPATRGVTLRRVATIHRDIVDVRTMTAIPDMLARGLAEMHGGLAFDRIVLFESDPTDADVLHVRKILDATGIPSAHGCAAPTVGTSAGGAVARAIASGTAVRGGDPQLDGELLACLGTTDFAVTPLAGGTANLGILVADRFLSRVPVDDDDVEVLALLATSLGLAIENAALHAAGKMLRSLAEKDDLTGVHNRRSVLAQFQREIDRARRYGKPLALVMIDVDHFKKWNDSHGHQVGDEILRAVAQIISSVSRDIDVFGRYGGEEFVVVLPETPIDHAMIYAERLRSTIEAHGESLKSRWPDAKLTVSVGISAMNLRGDDADKMIHRADAALYAAKSHGRNQICVDMAGAAPPAA